MAIFITGDMHGDLNRFNHPVFGLFGKNRIKKRDTLIICGDFGFIWDGSKKEQRLLKWLGRRRYDVVFVDGVHENFDELQKYEVEDWCGGKTRKISGKLRQLMRGQVFGIDGKRVLAFGGGQDAIQQTDFDTALNSLAKYENRVDYIVSYEPPTKIAEFLALNKSVEDVSDNLSYFLDEINERTDYKRWFFGKHHINKSVASKYFALFDDVINAEYDPAKK